MLIPTVCAALGAVAAHFAYTTLGLVLFAAAALIGCLIICSSLPCLVPVELAARFPVVSPIQAQGSPESYPPAGSNAS